MSIRKCLHVMLCKTLILIYLVSKCILHLQERYITIKERVCEKRESKDSGESGSNRHIFLDKSLSAALDSFDNLFCRRCLVRGAIKTRFLKRIICIMLFDVTLCEFNPSNRFSIAVCMDVLNL